MFAGVIASALVLPAFVTFFEAFRLRSPAVFLTGLFFLIGFGVSYYILLRWFLENGHSRPSFGYEAVLTTGDERTPGLRRM
jgi:hypothetical protein